MDQSKQESFQIIGSVYTDFYRARFLIDQLQSQLQNKDKEIQTLKGQITQLQEELMRTKQDNDKSKEDQ